MIEPDECIKCGNCSKICPVDSMGIGEEESVLNLDPYLCSNCWKCMEVCPNSIDIYGLMMEARKAGKMPESFSFSLELIINTGYSMPMERVNQIRGMHALEKVKLIDGEKIKKLLE